MCEVVTHWLKHIHQNCLSKKKYFGGVEKMRNLQVKKDEIRRVAFSGNVLGCAMHVRDISFDKCFCYCTHLSNLTNCVDECVWEIILSGNEGSTHLLMQESVGVFCKLNGF